MHPDQEQIIRFVSGRLPDDIAEAFYGHMDACAPCLQRVHAVRELHERFDESWEEFLAEARFRLTALSSATSPVEAEEAGESVDGGDRLDATAPIIVGLRAFLDGARRLASLASVPARAVTRAGVLQTSLQPTYGGIASADPSTLALQSEASMLLAGDDPDVVAIGAALALVATSQPAAAATLALNLVSDGDNVGQVVIDARRRVLGVLVQRDFLRQRTARAIVVGPDGSKRSQALSPVEAADYSLAEFETLPSGVFDVRLEIDDDASASD